MSTAAEYFGEAVNAFADGDLNAALTYIREAAAHDPENLVYAASVTYLENRLAKGAANAYASPEGFREFVRGGGNIPLYENTSAALRAVYRQYTAFSLLDVGTGDGLALIPALTSTISRLDVVEPSAALLENLEAQLQQLGQIYRAFHGTLQGFAANSSDHWDVAQGTYSLQSLPFEERPHMLRWLREHSDRLLIVEFDAPDFRNPLAPERIQHVLARNQLGLAEYAGNEVVIQGFLMPVMWGYFDRATGRLNYEQPVPAWVQQLGEAGFKQVTTELIYPYWWASAYLIDAR
ncbi:MAG: type 12 methyltransferase [Chloroflexi bacterium OLB15]|nr:MAG: type 12 methyltransferase [Chloroflexi bacterium OLB15]